MAHLSGMGGSFSPCNRLRWSGICRSISAFSSYKNFKGIIYINPKSESSPFPLNVSFGNRKSGKKNKAVNPQSTVTVLNIEYFLLKQKFALIKFKIKTSTEGKMNPYFTAVTPEYGAWGRFYCGF